MSALKAFESDHCELHDSPKIVRLFSNANEHLVFSDRVIKINEKGKYQDRTLIITNLAIYNVNKKKCSRTIPIEKVSFVTTSGTSGEMVLHHTMEYDYRMIVADQHKKALVKILRTVYSALCNGQVLKVVVVLDQNLARFTWNKDMYKAKHQRPQIFEPTEYHDSDEDRMKVEPEEELVQMHIVQNPLKKFSVGWLKNEDSAENKLAIGSDDGSESKKEREIPNLKVGTPHAASAAVQSQESEIPVGEKKKEPEPEVSLKRKSSQSSVSQYSTAATKGSTAEKWTKDSFASTFDYPTKSSMDHSRLSSAASRTYSVSDPKISSLSMAIAEKRQDSDSRNSASNFKLSQSKKPAGNTLLEDEKLPVVDEEVIAEASPSPLKKVTMDDFDLVKVIGRGTFGKVLLVRKKDSNVIYAMKIIKKSQLQASSQMQTTMNERNILAKVHHPFLMALQFAFQTKSKLYLVTDFYKGGDLFFHIGKQGKFSEDQARFIVAEVILALGHLHASGFVYRDLKPENILFDDTGHCCLTDFGVSKPVDHTLESETQFKSFCGTLEYLAPEIIEGTGYGKAVDWWAVGILLYELVVGLPPFHASTVPDIYRNIRYADPTFPESMSAECKDLLNKFLQKDPAQRIGTRGGGDIQDIKSHPFFASIDWSKLYNKEIIPPYIPLAEKTGDDDTSLFDDEFTQEPVTDSPDHLAANFLSPETKVQGFSFALRKE